MAATENLAWIDLEMTGLEVETCTIIEIASLVTGPDLTILAEGPNLAIHQPDSCLEAMDTWNTRQHAKSGLTELVRASEISLEDAESQTLEFFNEHCVQGKTPLSGNSIGHDRMFLNRYMPNLASFFHYRNVDVSTVKELVRRWYGEEAVLKKGANAHRALDDIRESVAEIRHYRDNFFVS